MENKESKISSQMDYATFFKFIEHIPSCIFFKDTELKYQFSSHFWAQLLNEDIIGKTDIEIRKDTENAIRAMEQDREIIATKKGCNYIIKSEIDGEVSYLELLKEPILDTSGEVIGIVGLINNVTEKTRMEQSLVKLSAKLERQCTELETSNTELMTSLERLERMHKAQKLFTASMNHELRSPLNGIIGNLQLLREDSTLDVEQQQSVNNAFLSAQQMLGIVNELLDFAKMEIGGFTIRSERFLLSAILDNIEYSYQVQAKQKGLSFSVTRDEKLPNELVGDATRIMQIIQNFVTNAIKYTNQGNVVLAVSYEAGKLVIKCSDTGQGIPDEALESLFDPFVRINENENAHIQGTGLGLSVVKKIVDSMKGEITVDSKMGVGSVFTVKIPADIANSMEEKPECSFEQLENQENQELDYSKLSALCVDDSKINAKVMEKLLQKIGMDTDVANSAKEGIEKAEHKKYDIIFMDHMMPEMDGIEAFRIIRGSSTLNAATPIVMLTGNADAGYKAFYKEQGLNGSLVKPVMVDQIKRMIQAVVR